MEGNRRPQQDAGETAGEPCVSQVQRDGSAVGQHAGRRRTGPAADAQCDQGDAGHAGNWDGDPYKVGSEKHAPDERRNNQQRNAGSGFTDSSENKHSFHCVYFQSFRALNRVRNGLKPLTVLRMFGPSYRRWGDPPPHSSPTGRGDKNSLINPPSPRCRRTTDSRLYPSNAPDRQIVLAQTWGISAC